MRSARNDRATRAVALISAGSLGGDQRLFGGCLRASPHAAKNGVHSDVAQDDAETQGGADGKRER